MKFKEELHDECRFDKDLIDVFGPVVKCWNKTALRRMSGVKVDV